MINPLYPGDFPKKNLESLRKQWVATLSYVYEFSKPIHIPCVLYHYKKDSVIDKKSLEKLVKAFTHHEQKWLAGNHPFRKSNYIDFEKTYLDKLFFEKD